MTELTTKQKFNRALNAARKEGVKVHQNVQKCCRSCIHADAESILNLDRPDQPFSFTYGGQGSAYRWVNDVPHYRNSDKKVDEVYFMHDNGAAPILFEKFKEFGLDVEWKGFSDFAAVTVRF